MRYDFVIVGSGIVGLATAYRLKQVQPHARVIVIEKEPEIAIHQTGRNSGVIHSGLYYLPGSQKAKLCFEGYGQLIEFAENHQIPYKLCGKLVVANGDVENARLQVLKRRGERNGLADLKLLVPEEAREKEPFVSCTQAMWVPQTGVIDYRQVCHALVGELVDKGVSVELECELFEVHESRNGLELVTENGVLQTRGLINCAGLYSDKVSEMCKDEASKVRVLPFRGEYYDLKPEAAEMVKGLVYPVPDPDFPFLGVHLTRGVHDQVEAGPNAVLAMSREGYAWGDVNLEEFIETIAWPGFRELLKRHWRQGLEEVLRSLLKARFLESLRRLIPDLMEEDLVKGSAGVRAQASHVSGGLIDDFAFSETQRVLNVLNAPSPAATSSLAIGQRVADRARRLL